MSLPSVTITRISQAPATSESTPLQNPTPNYRDRAPGKVAEYSVVLGKAPFENVSLEFSSTDSTEGIVQASTRLLTFTPQNWNVPQSLFVQGVDDFESDGNVAYKVLGKVVTEDLTYNRVTVPNINLINLQDDQDAPITPETWQGTALTDYFQGLNGNDILYAGGGQDQLRGGRGDDELFGEQDNDRLLGEEGNDFLYGGYGKDTLLGGEGNDEIFGEQGTDSLLGEQGNDYLDGGIQADTMSGGAGNDTYVVDSTGDVLIDNGASSDVDTVIVTQNITYTLAAGIENAQSTALGDSNITGNNLNNGLSGNDAKNILDGGEGKDSLSGGGGNDSLLGGGGNDEVAGGAGNDTMRGGAGVDCADFEAAGGALAINLLAGTATGEGSDLLFDFEDICSGKGNDTLTGNKANNKIEAGEGNDRVDAGLGNDKVDAGHGNDSALGGDGLDVIDGGLGRDSLSGGAGNDTLTGCADGANGGLGEIDRLSGGAGADIYELGWSGGAYYNDGVIGNAGFSDYVVITDFQVGTDRLVLDGGIGNYRIGASVSGVTGFGLYLEQGATDELVAVIQSTTAVTVSNTIAVAQFV